MNNFIHTKNRVTKYLKPLVDKFEICGLPLNLEEYVSLNPTMRQNKNDFLRVLAQNKGYFVGTKYEDWFNIFKYDDALNKRELLKSLFDDNPIIGWSCSNALKRATFTSEDENLLIQLFYKQTDPLKRWRIAHALGNATEDNSSTFLLNILEDNDEYYWVSLAPKVFG